MNAEFPGYDALFQRPGAAKGTAWGLWGDDDQFGTINLLTPERVVQAAALVRSGERFNLDYPVNAFEPFPTGTRYAAGHHTPPERGPDHNGMIHRPLIALLGMALGELWALDELAADCAGDQRYEFLLVVSPLNLVGGAGSPCNAIAIK